MTHITDYGGAIDDYYPARMERIKDMELTELERRADIEAEESRMTPEVLDGGWQPIETAPKGKKILVCQSLNGIIALAHGVDRFGNWKTGPSAMDYIAEVTHWMPLPKTPS